MKTYLYLSAICLFSMSLAATTFGEMKIVEVPKEEPVEEAQEDANLQDIELPAKDSPEYWVVRSEAMGELTPLLTKKRADMKQKRQMLADYLLKIGKAEAMAAAEIEVPDDPALYAKALGVDEGLEQRDVTLPEKTPTWDELAEFSMQFVIYEGYRPMQLDGVEDIRSFIELCEKKEAYAKKVRKEMRSYVKDCLKMWIYLGTIDQQAACKKWAAQMKVDAEKSKNAERAMIAEERRLTAMERKEAEKERKFQDAQDRASFRSSRRERHYQSRDDRLQYRQTRMDERYTNYYRW
ncbi:MAG: hypothetical protein ABFR90_11150 [Planctomycetota bacterium]